MNPVDDNIFILKLVSKGDEKAFNLLFHKYFVSVCRFANVYVEDQSISEELALDVFANLWERREEITITTSLKSYLFQSVRNKCLNYIRDHQHLVSIESVNLVEAYELNDSVEYDELNRLVEEAIYSLPEKCREVFEKSRKDELSNKEIALQMNISVRTVDAHIVAALNKIRKYIKRNYWIFFLYS